MPRKKTKYGKRVNVYLSNESLDKLSKLSDNRSATIDALIVREYEKKTKRLED